jgi:hypothetical protein
VAVEASRRILPLEPEPGVLARDAILEERVGEVEERVKEVSGELEALRGELESRLSIVASLASRVDGLEAFKRAAEMVGGWKLQTCIYQVNGVCMLWRLSREAAEQLGPEVTVEDPEEKGVYRVKVSAIPWFCALCPLYQRKAKL